MCRKIKKKNVQGFKFVLTGQIGKVCLLYLPRNPILNFRVRKLKPWMWVHS